MDFVSDAVMNRTVAGADPFSQYRTKAFQHKMKGLKLWSTWTWTRSLESTLHLDDVQDHSKSSMQFQDYAISSNFDRGLIRCPRKIVPNSRDWGYRAVKGRVRILRRRSRLYLGAAGK